MKKYLALFLIALVLLAFLVSCSTPQSGNDVVSSDIGATQDSSKQSHTIGDCSTSDSSHLPSAPPQDNSTTNSSIQNPDVPTEKINTVTWQFTYDYGFHHTDVVTLLVDYGYLRGDFEWIVIPNDIVAGDTITINYTGDYIIQETYPGKIMLDGEVISYSFSYANVIAMRAESLTAEMLLEYDAPNNYIILDRGGRYTTLDKYEGDVVYLVEDQRTVRPRTEDMPFYVACMLAYNPRDLQDGIPEYENVSKAEAEQIARDDYYYTYYVNYEEQLEFEIIETKDLEGYWEIYIFEYWSERVFYYKIDKIMGGIVSMGITE